jgi:hypothetical protein
MTFHEFWPLYLKAHRLPGTRALHYFATVIGISASIDAIVTLQPLVFVIGVPLSYCIAIGSHRLIEGNQPMIRVNAAWGALADLRMCWLAITGGLDAELAKHGLADQMPSPAQARMRRWIGGLAWQQALLVASTVGMTAALMDLHDLIEPGTRLPYPAIQLGFPIVAFAAALVVSCADQMAAQRVPVPTTVASRYAAPIPGSDTSLQYACVLLLIFGATALGLTELFEHEALQPLHAVAAAVLGGHPSG